MKLKLKNNKVIYRLLMMTLFLGITSAQELDIVNDDIELTVGDSVLLEAIYIDTSGNEIDTTVVWSVSPDSLGSITETGLFFADLPGECIVSVDLDTLSDWISVIINMEEEEDTSGNSGSNAFIIFPEDTIITLGSQVQYLAYYRDENGDPGELVDTTLTWSLQGMPVGDLSQEGLLTASATGFALVHAQFEELDGIGFVIVADSSYDSTGLNTITITKDSPNPQGYSVMQELTEGELWTIGGLPHPMNILNGGGVYFPIGSLTEDVRIHTTLPDFANVVADSVGWGAEGVVGGVDFSVIVNDTTVEPYYFETPLIAGLVYKRGLLQNLGIDPLTLGLYYAIIDGDSVVFDTAGIGYPTVDLDRNRIFSSVAHFSSLAIKGETGTVVSTEPDQPSLPEGYALMQNYPNPFNPITTIKYELPEQTHVKLVIYDLLGKEVSVLVNGIQETGVKEIRFDANGLASGIYFYQLVTQNNQITRRLIVLK